MGKFKITKNTKDIHCRVKIGDNPETDGIILRQKASKRFLVTDGKNTGICTVSDYDDGKLVSNTMTLTVKKQNGTLQRVEFLSNKFAVDFDKNRFIITGAKTNAHENATVLTDEAKAKLTKPKKAPAKKSVAKKAPAKKPVAKKAPAKKSVAKKAPKESINDTLFDFSITED